MVSSTHIRYLWRTKYPWFFVVYILVIGLLRGLVENVEHTLALNLLMVAAFSSYIFLFVFYLYGVRPLELEHHFHKRR